MAFSLHAIFWLFRFYGDALHPFHEVLDGGFQLKVATLDGGGRVVVDLDVRFQLHVFKDLGCLSCRLAGCRK